MFNTPDTYWSNRSACVFLVKRNIDMNKILKKLRVDVSRCFKIIMDIAIIAKYIDPYHGC